jgi:hypothetical protein
VVVVEGPRKSSFRPRLQTEEFGAGMTHHDDMAQGRGRGEGVSAWRRSSTGSGDAAFSLPYLWIVDAFEPGRRRLRERRVWCEPG